jgi:hypothetical protein
MLAEREIVPVDQPAVGPFDGQVQQLPLLGRHTQGAGHLVHPVDGLERDAAAPERREDVV